MKESHEVNKSIEEREEENYYNSPENYDQSIHES